MTASNLKGMRQFKVVILGACFIRNGFIDSETWPAFDPMAEGNSYHRDFVVDGRKNSIEFLDTVAAGQFSSLVDVYIQSAHGFVLAFDLIRLDSLGAVDRFLQYIYRVKGREENIPIAIVGTKLDLLCEEQLDVARSMIAMASEKWKMPFYETSAKQDWNVSQVFEDLVRKMRKWERVDDRIQKRRQMSRSCSHKLDHGATQEGCVLM